MSDDPVWLDDDEIAERLATLDPEQVRVALGAMTMRLAEADEVDLAPSLTPLAEVLDGDLDPEQVELLARHRLGLLGEPRVERDLALDDLAELALRLRGTSAQYALAIVLRIDDRAPEAVRHVVAALGRGLAAGEARVGNEVDYFLSNLLDDGDVRGAVIEAMATWPRRLHSEQLLVQMAPELSDAERRAVGLDDDATGFASS